VPGRWTELVSTDSLLYGGSDIGNLGGVETEDVRG
jgi:1,4-alpha-glucan branching enzyme